ncbi:hypothetical protein PQX77_013367 [Marasmius sp. AFHP31]|nr:hypothetical protein PQX77_013367 [Marasmius sp. AFHP31]
MSEHEHQQMEDFDDVQVSQPPTIPPPPPVQHPLLHGSWAHDTAGLAAVPEISVPNPEYQIPEDERFVTVGMIRGLNNKISELKALINGSLPPVDKPATARGIVFDWDGMQTIVNCIPLLQLHP